MASGLIFHHLPGKTILHTLDPRVKLPGYLALSLIGIAGGKVTLVILAGCIGFGYTLGHSHPAIVLRSGAPFWILVGSLFVFRSLFIGLESGVLETLRLVLLVFLSHLFLSVTSNSELQKALRYYLSFLPKKTRERFVLSISITLLLLPTLVDLAQDIRDALVLRRFKGSRPISRHVKLFSSVFFRKAFRLASELSEALEVRGFI
jgi:energy-coupling factor transport system permease protein